MNIHDSIKDNWFQINLEQAINSRLPDLPLMSELRSSIVSWKLHLNAIPEREKTKQINYAVAWIINSSLETSISQMKLCLRLIEDVVLSPKISTLSKKNFLHRRVCAMNNRAFTLAGLENYIQVKYPQVKIFYFDSIPMDFFSRQQFKDSFKVYEDVWLVVQHGKFFHKTLVKLTNIQERLQITIFDSLGMSHDTNSLISSDTKEKSYRGNLMKLVQALSLSFALDDINFFSKPRQKDNGNCSAFIVFDLETALNLKKENKPIFSDSYENGMHSEFFKISQYVQDVSLMNSNCIRKYDHLSKSEKKGNSQALLVACSILSFSLNSSPLYVKEKANLEEVSDIDEEGCCTM